MFNPFIGYRSIVHSVQGGRGRVYRFRRGIMIFEKCWSEGGGAVRDEQDSSSHRVIEKRRRDRINSSLADLGRLVQTSNVVDSVVRPSQYTAAAAAATCSSSQQTRIKKTEIIDMAIQRIRHLHSQLLGIPLLHLLTACSLPDAWPTLC